MSRMSVRSVLLALGVTLLVAFATESPGQPSPPRDRQFTPGSLRRLEDLPSGRFREQLDRLPGNARLRALDWLQRLHFTELDLDSLHADQDGGVFFADEFTVEPTAEATEPPGIGEAAVPVSPFPASLIFHSRPGAPNVIYLNFAGETVTGTAWNTSLNRTSIPAVAFSTDADLSTYSDAEQAVIKRVWLRMAEDFAPFDVDVTTERPAVFTSRTAHALITRNTDANGDPNPSTSAGGVAYVNVFASGSHATYRPAWVYHNNLSNSEANIAEAASHEIGHNLGLSHDGKTDGASYYNGHGSGDTSWGPIMGTGYGRNVSQWSKGEYYLANNTEDDLGTIVGKLTYRADDHGDTRPAATALVLTGTNVVSTTPENDPANANPANKGVFSSSADVDVFSFVTGNGPMSLRVNPWIMPSGTRGGNLDVRLELYNEAGVLLLTNSPASNTYATIQTNLTDGLYFLSVRNTGVGTPLATSPSGYTAYGSLGQYFISGYLRPSGYIAPPQAEAQVTDLTQTGVASKPFTVTYTDDVAVDVSTVDGNDVRVLGPNGYNRAAQFVSLNNATDGTPRVATYTIQPATNAVWSHTDNGVYTIVLQTNQVGDTEGVWVASGPLGQFTVNLPLVVYSQNLNNNPGWTLQSQWQYGPPAYPGVGPTNGYTGANILGYNLSGNYPNNLATVYATTPPINCAGVASLTLRFQRWLRVRSGDTAAVQVSTNGTTWTNVWAASGTVSDTAWQPVQYTLPAWTEDQPAVQLRWSMGSGSTQNDIGWNLDDVEIIGVPAAVDYTLTATANNPAWGTVTPTNVTGPSGSSVQLTATPATWFRFANWTGGATGSNNPQTVVLSSNTTVQAVFGELLTTNHPTPLWWLAAIGVTNNFESAVTSSGNNAMPLWQSYLAGLNPNDPASQLRLNLTSFAGNSAVLQWNTVTGRVYSIWASTNPAGGFAPVAGAVNLPATSSRFTNTVSPSVPATYYRLQVQKP